jgi:rubrerythrin
MGFLVASDIVDLAMQLEQNGERYYRAVAKKTNSPRTRALFEDLADQEVKHYKVFGKLAQSVQDRPLMSDQEWDEYMRYLSTTVQSAFFEGPDKALAIADKMANEKEAIRMAMGFEKETLLFFYDLRDVVRGEHREFVDKIVAEEKTHLRRLADML